MNDVAHGYQPTPHDMVKPHQQPGSQKQDSAQHNRPEVRLLPPVKESHFFGLHVVFIRGVAFHSFQPSRVRRRPGHRHKPIQKLKDKEDFEEETKPWMQETSHWSATEKWRQKAKQPRRVDGEAGKQGQNESDSHRPVQHARVNRMTQQLAAMYDVATNSICLTTGSLVETIN